MSEALYLGKPVFSIPVDWQFEQWLNARYLDDLGYGLMCEYPRHFDVLLPKFLASLDRYRQNIARHDFFGNELVLARILEFLPESKPVAAVAR